MADLLADRIRTALSHRLSELGTHPSAIRSKLLKALPTTLAVAYVVAHTPYADRYLCHALWAGDSRVYVVRPEVGAQQVSTDDLRSQGDAMANLMDDSVMSNCVSADTEFHINYRSAELQAPFVVLCATDGCFGYLPTPMHFEHLVLSTLVEASNEDAWREALRARVSAVTGDDSSLALMAIGGGVEELGEIFRPRLELVTTRYVEPLDDLERQEKATQEQAAELRSAARRFALSVGRIQAGIRGPFGPGAVEGRPGEAVDKGDVINGYRILQDFSVVGAGLSKWTFAEKDGRQYFLKEFLRPTYPNDDAPGSEATKAKKRKRCAAFEEHHWRIQAATQAVSSAGGNLIVTLDFFRWGAKYYKVTEKVDVAAGFEVSQIAALDFEDRLVIMKSVAHSLKVLQGLGIVHGDLKPSNVLIKKTELAYTAKLIDFDDSYFAGNPPPPDEIVGTMNYYSPELVSYIEKGDPSTGSSLGPASDVFTLGLIYAEYLMGVAPAFDQKRYDSQGVAVRAGDVLRVAGKGDIPNALNDIVEQMLLADPVSRPTIADVHAALMRARRAPEEAEALPTASLPPMAPVPTAPSAPPPASSVPPSSGGLKGKGLRVAGGHPTPAAAPAAATSPEVPADEATPAPDSTPPPPSGLVGKLLKRVRKSDES